MLWAPGSWVEPLPCDPWSGTWVADATTVPGTLGRRCYHFHWYQIPGCSPRCWINWGCSHHYWSLVGVPRSWVLLWFLKPLVMGSATAALLVLPSPWGPICLPSDVWIAWASWLCKDPMLGYKCPTGCNLKGKDKGNDSSPWCWYHSGE